MSEENLGASSGGGSDGGSGHKKLILKRESCSCDSGDRVSDAGSRRSKSIGEIFFWLKMLRNALGCNCKWCKLHSLISSNLHRGKGGGIWESKEADIQCREGKQRGRSWWRCRWREAASDPQWPTAAQPVQHKGESIKARILTKPEVRAQTRHVALTSASPTLAPQIDLQLVKASASEDTQHHRCKL